MSRLIRLSVIAVLAFGLAACGGSTASEEPDTSIAPEALARALADDRDAALAAYGGKVLELSGTVGANVTG
jgi:hypothetical protein